MAVGRKLLTLPIVSVPCSTLIGPLKVLKVPSPRTRLSTNAIMPAPHFVKPPSVFPSGTPQRSGWRMRISQLFDTTAPPSRTYTITRSRQLCRSVLSAVFGPRKSYLAAVPRVAAMPPSQSSCARELRVRFAYVMLK